MGKRVAIRDVESGKIFKTMSAAEREYGIKEGTISWLIDKGEPICGHMFVRVNDVATEVVESVLDFIPVVDMNPPINGSEDGDLRELVRHDYKVSYSEGPRSAWNQDELVSYLTSRGYTARIESNVVIVYGINTAKKSTELRELVEDSGYCRSWGWSPLLGNVEETGKPYAYIEK